MNKKPIKLEPQVTFSTNLEDLTLDNLPINIPPYNKPEELPVKSNSKSLF